MTHLAEFLKKSTIERYEYLMHDGFSKYESLLAEARTQPDRYWEDMSLAMAKHPFKA